ncbi:glycogen debranching N-terminal domain-containing protein [Microbacterium sp. ASV81]|uniref:Glycogen debranching N-terminal domain-containing protein n=1 Tax=Microbacterium capsulatum TaxID=3041921 RepID=A0ABU0XFF0_9MICO|nr:glycogen debranching N-terminal domain-containing protein [Microbacterium sp. ASV81]MDQ4213848.1 glycogen debranching N-terminal domain-containing protein [Microbacterium sp. ASV81]
MTASPPPLQPLLDDAVIALQAPTQVWSDETGDLGSAPIHGVYHGDVRHVRVLAVTVEGTEVESIACSSPGPQQVVFAGVLRGIDDDQPDPKVRLDRTRTVRAGGVAERIRITSHREVPVPVAVTARIVPDFAPLQQVKAGLAHDGAWDWDGTRVTSGTASFGLTAPGAEITVSDAGLAVRWSAVLAPRSTAEFALDLALADDALVVTAPASAPHPAVPDTTDPRLRRWLDRAAGDLAALRLAVPAHPEDAFYAAGAPWFFTLFGRDSIWAARLALTLDPAIAASTLRVLGRLQGTKKDPATAEAPGKIPHELRSGALSLPNEGVRLPPLYYGTVDATPLWVCLLADARDAGMPEAEVRALLPNLRAALGWMIDHGDASGSGFIDYVDQTGHGLANQGWKDSGDSIQWRDGRLAEGPIALSEVQAYAYEAAVRGADLLDALGEAGSEDLRTWAANLRDRFRAAYWVVTPEGRYPAIALDAHGAAVDSLTSNIGHLIGTGLLDPEEERACTALLRGDTMSSGFGIRTMSSGAAGFWPLSYHGGSVWAHDTAVAVHGMLRAGLREDAAAVARQLVDAAEGFDYRMPELHAGDARVQGVRPVPYPASCRPQAWSAAAAVVCAEALG